MTAAQQLIATLVGALVLIIGAATPVIISVLRLLKVKADAARQDLEDAAAKRAVALAAEVGAVRKLPGTERAQIAETYFKTLVPDATDRRAADAVRSAVGATPGVGESSKENPMFPPPLSEVQ